MGKVVDISAKFLGELPVEKVFQNAMEAGLKEVLILGWREDTDEFYLHASHPDGPDVVYNCQLAIKIIMDVQDQD